MAQKLCKDCKWVNMIPVTDMHDQVVLNRIYKCINPKVFKNPPVGLVTGDPVWDGYPYCAEQRYSTDEERCGKEGRFWQPKEDG